LFCIPRNMSEEFRIERYCRSDRERAFDLIHASYPAIAPILIRNWEWMYDCNPFNRDAECERRSNREQLLAFLRSVYSAERLESFGRKWGFGDDKFELLDEPYVLLMKNNRDEVIAMEGSLPQRFLVDGKEQWVSIACNWTVHPKYRNQRLAQALVNRLRTDNALIFAWQNAASQKFATRWRKATARRTEASGSVRTDMPVVPMIKPIEWGPLVNLLSSNRLIRATASIIGTGTGRLQRALQRSLPSHDIRVTRIDSFDQSVDQLWRAAACKHRVIAVRDRRYLNWRFTLRPQSPYTIVAAFSDSGMIGYLIFRVADHLGVSCGFLVDYLVEDRTVFSLVLEHAEELLRNEHVAAIICSVATAPYRRILFRHGFFPVPFRPRTHLAVQLNSADPRLRAFLEVSRWFITMGDGNLDMHF
jgi:hypothetical protein